jgi:hypothetical protein
MVCRKESPDLAILLKGCFVKVYYMSNALNSFVTYLADGNTVTSRQVRAMFKVDNAADLAYRARNEGISVYTNRVTNSRGEKVFAYRLGNPSKQFEKYLDQGHIARARKTLYRDAISVTMG